MNMQEIKRYMSLSLLCFLSVASLQAKLNSDQETRFAHELHCLLDPNGGQLVWGDFVDRVLHIIPESDPDYKELRKEIAGSRAFGSKLSIMSRLERLPTQSRFWALIPPSVRELATRLGQERIKEILSRKILTVNTRARR